MIKASAFYIVIIISLVIALLCSSMIVAAYFYKSEYQRKFRYDRLANNVGSGVNILLTSGDTAYSHQSTFSLFGGDQDSVSLRRLSWGIYDIGIVRAFSQIDTLYKTFSFANSIDSVKWAVLYLSDGDRPLGLCGKTTIKGDAYIPKSDIQQVYVNGVGYQGDKRFIIGSRHLSNKKLPALDDKRLQLLQDYFSSNFQTALTSQIDDSINRSFLIPTRVISFKKNTQTLKSIKITNNVILISDTTLIIDSTATLQNVLLFAPSIIVKKGFHGNCQLFARDSIKIDSNCNFGYPSCLGIIRFGKAAGSTQAKISVGNGSNFNGILFSYEMEEGMVKPLIIIGKKTKIIGQIYSQGILELDDQSKICGNVTTSGFVYKNSSSLFENYLVNTTLDATALSPYYLTSSLLPLAKKSKKVLQWLEN